MDGLFFFTIWATIIIKVSVGLSNNIVFEQIPEADQRVNHVDI